MRLAPRRNRCSNESRRRHQRLCQRGTKGKVTTESGRSSRGGRGLAPQSTITERELFITLDRPRLSPLIPPRFRHWLSEMLAAAELVPIVEPITACRDPKDDKFLELAVNGRADLVVSGDADLLVLNPFRGIPIVTPAAFVRILQRLSTAP